MKTKKLVYAAVTGAAYAALTMLLAPISYGAVQLRVSECLCLLPFFVPCTAWGLFVGCAIANLLSAAGLLDVVFGSLATLVSCLLVAALGKKSRGWGSCVAACCIPVIVNALVVGAVLALTLAEKNGALLPVFAVCAAQVGAGEAAVMFALGLPLLRLLPKQPFFLRLTERTGG